MFQGGQRGFSCRVSVARVIVDAGVGSGAFNSASAPAAERMKRENILAFSGEKRKSKLSNVSSKTKPESGFCSLAVVQLESREIFQKPTGRCAHRMPLGASSGKGTSRRLGLGCSGKRHFNPVTKRRVEKWNREYKQSYPRQSGSFHRIHCVAQFCPRPIKQQLAGSVRWRGRFLFRQRHTGGLHHQ